MLVRWPGDIEEVASGRQRSGDVRAGHPSHWPVDLGGTFVDLVLRRREACSGSVKCCIQEEAEAISCK
jgi:hypothetical protein